MISNGWEIVLGNNEWSGVRRLRVTGIRRGESPHPLPGKAPTRYVHRTQYIRDLHEPKE